MAVLKAKIDENRSELTNRRGVLFYHGNSRFHIMINVIKDLLRMSSFLGCFTPYSPNLARLDFPFSSRPHKNYLNEQKILSLILSNSTLITSSRLSLLNFTKKGVLQL